MLQVRPTADRSHQPTNLSFRDPTTGPARPGPIGPDRAAGGTVFLTLKRFAGRWGPDRRRASGAPRASAASAAGRREAWLAPVLDRQEVSCEMERLGQKVSWEVGMEVH